MKAPIDFRKLNPDEVTLFQELLLLFEDVFEMTDFEMPSKGYLSDLLGKSSFCVYVALEQEKVIGGLTGYTLSSYYKESAEMYVYDLAVLTDYQRKGIGKSLMEKIISDCRSANIRQLFVQADREDCHAVKFYESIGGNAEDVIHFTFDTGNP